VVRHSYNPSSSEGRGSQSKASPGQFSVRAYLKHKTKSKRTEGVAQAVKPLPSKCEVLSSILCGVGVGKLEDKQCQCRKHRGDNLPMMILKTWKWGWGHSCSQILNYRHV
jgi:hypothetical protein